MLLNIWRERHSVLVGFLFQLFQFVWTGRHMKEYTLLLYLDIVLLCCVCKLQAHSIQCHALLCEWLYSRTRTTNTNKCLKIETWLEDTIKYLTLLIGRQDWIDHTSVTEHRWRTGATLLCLKFKIWAAATDSGRQAPVRPGREPERARLTSPAFW